jgi:26S proteasome regulatory subunit N12
VCSRLFKDIPPSSYQYQILGLNLLRLLALNRIAEFHTELELIPLDKHDNIYIKHPIQLEQYIMEGSYNKVFSAAKDLPAPSYSFFIEYLMDLRLKYAPHTHHRTRAHTHVCS